MTRTAFYNVAGHTFSLTLPENPRLWGALGQYSPFEVPVSGEALFGLTLVESIPEDGMEVIHDMPTEDGETVIKLYRRGEDWIFSMSPDHSMPICARLQVSSDFKSAGLCLLSRRLFDALFGINNALMLLYAFNTATLGTLEMHASMVSNSGKAYLFLARSGTGKSTHSSLWMKHIPGTELMNDDNPIVRVLEDGSVIAYGSPWSGKTPCYRNVQAPVGAFVQIRRCQENRITPMSVLEAYACLYSSSSGYKADRKFGDGLHATMEKIVTSVPCYVLDCRPDEEAAQVCASAVR